MLLSDSFLTNLTAAAAAAAADVEDDGEEAPNLEAAEDTAEAATTDLPDSASAVPVGVKLFFGFNELVAVLVIVRYGIVMYKHIEVRHPVYAILFQEVCVICTMSFVSFISFLLLVGVDFLRWRQSAALIIYIVMLSFHQEK